MKRLIIRGLISGTANLSPGVLAILRAIGRAERPKTHRPRCARESEGADAIAHTSLPVSTSFSEGGPGRLVFVQVLPGRWIRCTGTMAARPVPSGETNVSTDTNR
jgi:hypothetical protein